MIQRSNHTSRRNAFTIVEMLVVIGILVVVAVGVATIFGSVGETVARGRKLSELNQFAARIERVMREDFERMTRDGFLVIVNKNANFGRDVQLYRGEQTNVDENLFGGFSGENGRIRRSDEIMFFARGDFETGRRAIASNMRASSNEAAIYYGHGQKRLPDLTPGSFGTEGNNFFFNPQPWDNNYEDRNGDGVNDGLLGYDAVGFANPNQFARDWSLLRHVTLLVNPQGSGQAVPKELYGFSSDISAEREFLKDSTRQIALQPAARSIFKAMSGTGLTLPTFVNPRWLYDESGFPQPRLPSYRTSGVVDIVSEDLSTIRNLVMSLPATDSTFDEPGDYYNYIPDEPMPVGNNPIGITRDFFEALFYDNSMQPRPQDALLLKLGALNMNGRWRTTPNYYNTTHVDNIRKWMIDALPSNWDMSVYPPNFVGGVRYEDIPTRVLYEDDDFASFGNMERRAMARAYAEANQEMLGASVFVPRCTEFVIEWSYGFVDNSISDVTNPNFKRLIWYGLDRFVDSDGDGLIEQSDQRAAQTYRQRASGSAGADPATTPATNRPIGPEPRLVVGRELGIAGVASPDLVDIACFGFSTVPGGVPGSGGSGADVTEGAYWPWPKLVRITMSLGDPNDRDVEETYQVIFELPKPN